MNNALPSRSETDQLAAMERYGILDIPPDAVLDGIAKAAASLCDTPVALINFIGPTSEWANSDAAFPLRESQHDLVFCNHAIMQSSALMEVEDASKDQRFSDNPHVTGESMIRFYAGCPLRTSEQLVLGTLCVIDNKPRQLSAAQRDGLCCLAQVVMDILDERRGSRSAAIDRVTQLADATAAVELAKESNNQVAQIVEDSENEIFIVDAQNYRILTANRAARNNLGYSQKEFNRMMPWDFVEELNQESLKALLAPLCSGLVNVNVFEAMHRRKDGSTYPVLTNLHYMATEDPPVFTATVRDITERRRHEEDFDLRNRAIEAVDVGISITDATQADYPLVNVNEALCRLTGYTREELLGRGVLMLQKNDLHQPELRQIREAQAKGEPIQVVIKSTRKDGSDYMDELSLSPVRNEKGDLTHYICINRDVTSKLDTEAMLHQTRKIEAIGRLSGGIAHDFNNLLNVITGNLEFLGNGPLDEEQRDFLNKATNAAKMGARLTRRLLTFARQRQLEPVVLNVNESVRATIELLDSTIGETINLSSNLSNDLWSIRADPSEIENTLVNLVINARDAMPGGGTIKIHTENVCVTDDDIENDFGIPPGEYIHLSVSDSGTGMTEQVRARIFEPFFTTRESDQGTGLGLASIHGFVHQSGGHIQVFSEVGHGTVIMLFLPKYLDASVSQTATQPAKVKPIKNNARVLVVEDNELVRELTVNRLQVLGFNIEQASNGLEAIQYLETNSDIDLILSDIIMNEGMSGYDVAQWVQDRLPECKILLTSGFSEHSAEYHDAQLANLPVLPKPHSLVELRQAIIKILDIEMADA